jgi:AcrR family transcriptional regulator
MLGRDLRNRATVAGFVREHGAVIVRWLTEAGAVSSLDGIETVLRYVAASAVFWSTQHYREMMLGAPGDIPFEPEKVTLDAAARTDIIRRGSEHILTGFMPTALETTDRERVERIAWISETEMPEQDRILAAIRDVVLELGYASATVERIAEALNLSKSGLYHYFANKDEMLSQAVMRTQSHFASLARVRFGQLETNEERFYALFVMIASYSSHDSTMLIVENWLRETNIEVHIPPSHIAELLQIYEFITEMIMHGEIAARREDAFAILAFANYLMRQELTMNASVAARNDRTIALTRRVFELFAGGVTCLQRSKGNTQ